MAYTAAYKPPVAAQDRRPAPPDNLRWNGIPQGRYALFHKGEQRWHFFLIKRPDSGKWWGWTFVLEIIGDNLIKISPSKRENIFKHIAADPLKASKDYGKQSGTCGRCGKTLTDPDSIAEGIGPVCITYYE